MARGPHNRSRKLGTSFHETFSLNRPALHQVLEVVNATDGPLSFDVLREHTNMGKSYVKSMPRYAYGCGLITEDDQLTALGRMALQNDQGLQKPETQWAMHYFLTVDGGPGPAFWHELITERLRVGMSVTVKGVAQWISSLVQESGQALAERTLQDTARIFLRSYSNDDALHQLGLIREDEQRDGRYQVHIPAEPPTYALGCAVADYWERTWGDQDTTNLNALNEELGAIFFLGEGQFGDALRSLQRLELLDVWRIAPPYQVVRKWETAEQLWMHLYEY